MKYYQRSVFTGKDKPGMVFSVKDLTGNTLKVAEKTDFGGNDFIWSTYVNSSSFPAYYRGCIFVNLTTGDTCKNISVYDVPRHDPNKNFLLTEWEF